MSVADREILAADLIAAALPGAWRLAAWTIEHADGRRSTPFGAAPSGYLLYTTDGHMAACVQELAGNATGRPLRTFAYAGSYAVEDGYVAHTLGMATVVTMTGTIQRREVRISGRTLTLLAHDAARGRTDRIEWFRPERPG